MPDEIIFTALFIKFPSACALTIEKKVIAFVEYAILSAYK